MSRALAAATLRDAALDYSAYARLTSLLSPLESVKPKSKTLVWLMRLVEEIVRAGGGAQQSRRPTLLPAPPQYDLRYARDTADLQGAAAEDAGGSGGGGAGPFPSFAVDFLSKRYGLKALIDQVSGRGGGGQAPSLQSPRRRSATLPSRRAGSCS